VEDVTTTLLTAVLHMRAQQSDDCDEHAPESAGAFKNTDSAFDRRLQQLCREVSVEIATGGIEDRQIRTTWIVCVEVIRRRGMGYRVHIFHRLIERAFLPVRVLLVPAGLGTGQHTLPL
jgi:hypothetical protein